MADRIVERLQNKKARTAILVFDACRNNPFERSGTRAVAGGGGLAPSVELTHRDRSVSEIKSFRR
jgi:hypothetical protein